MPERHGPSPFDLKVEHDLRTPLSIIRGYLSLLEAGEVSLETSLPALRVAADSLEVSIEALLARAKEAR